jgi:hypothetical protein
MPVSENEQSALSEYLKNLFDEFQKNRKPLAKEAQRNLDAFKSISTDVWKHGEAEGWRSDTVVPLTHEKVMAAYSVILDTTLREGKIPVKFEQSPYEEEELQDLPEEQRAAIEETIDEADDLVGQQFQDCKADKQYARNVLSNLIYGETYAKYHTHIVKRSGWKQVSMAPEGVENPEQYTRFEPFVNERTQPGWKYVSWWSIYRDLEDDDLQKNAGIIEREMITAYELRRLKGGEYYLDEQIENAIKAAKQPGNQESAIEDQDDMPPYLREVMHRRKTIDRKFFWCRVPRHIAEDFENNVIKKMGDVESYWIDTEFSDGDEVEIHAEMADEHVIRYARVPEGERPYERAVLEELLDHPNGSSMPGNLRHSQRGATGAVRAVEDNLKLSANIILAQKPNALKMKDKEFVPGKNIEISDEIDDVRQGMMQVVIQDVSQSLLPILGIFERYADEAANMPKIMQGQTHAKDKPDTLGEINILQSNSLRYAGTIIRNLDNGLVEPMSNRFHKFNMEDPDQTKGKGNFVARPMGFSAFQDRVVRIHKIMQGLALVMKFPQLEAETKTRAILEDIWQFNDVDPEKYIKSEDEKRQEASEKMQAMIAQLKLKKQLEAEAIATQEQVKDADHARDIEKEAVKSELKKDEKGQEFDQEITKAVMDAVQRPPAMVNQGLQ